MNRMRKIAVDRRKPSGIEQLAQANIALPDGLYIIPVDSTLPPARSTQALHRRWSWLASLGFALPLAMLVLWQAASLLGY